MSICEFEEAHEEFTAFFIIYTQSTHKIDIPFKVFEQTIITRLQDLLEKIFKYVDDINRVGDCYTYYDYDDNFDKAKKIAFELNCHHFLYDFMLDGESSRRVTMVLESNGIVERMYEHYDSQWWVAENYLAIFKAIYGPYFSELIDYDERDTNEFIEHSLLTTFHRILHDLYWQTFLEKRFGQDVCGLIRMFL